MKRTFIPWGSCSRRKLPCVAQRICVRVAIRSHILQVTLGVGKQGVLLADLMAHAITADQGSYAHTYTHTLTHILHRCSELNLVPNFLVSVFVRLNIMLSCLSPWVTLSLVSVVQKSETYFLFVSGYDLQGAVSNFECGDLSSSWRLSEGFLFTLGLLGSHYWVIFGKPGLCPSSVWPPASLLCELSPDL